MHFQYIFTVKKTVQVIDEDSIDNKIGKLFESVEANAKKIAADQKFNSLTQRNNFTRITDDMQQLKLDIHKNNTDIEKVKK